MDLKRLTEPTFVVGALCCVLLVALLASRLAEPSPQRATSTESVDVRPHLRELHAAINAVDARFASLDDRLNNLEETLEQRTDEPIPDDELDIEIHTKADAEKLVTELGSSPTSSQLAECLAEIDVWVGTPQDWESLQAFKIAQVSALRQLVKKELADLHNKALKAETGAMASDYHAKASQVIALYPMDSSKSVLDEAKHLSSRHSEVGVRIDVIRRQRYNAWAMTRIQETINEINSIASSFKTSDNPKTIDAAVKHLGEIDPLLLEPVVAQLYNHAVEQAKSNVNSEQQLELGRRMINPAIRRKAYGDF